MRNERNFKKLAIVLTVFLLIFSIFIPIAQSEILEIPKYKNEIKNSSFYDNDFTIILHRIKAEDEIDPWPHGEPDWQIRMYVNDIQKTYECNGLDVTIDKAFTWSQEIPPGTEIVNIKMELLDRDTGIWPDLHDIADISAYVDPSYQPGDYDDTDNFGNHRPAVFKRSYNIIENTWQPINDNNDYLNTENQPPLFWYITSGNYDGSTTTDQNDATVWFNVSYGNTPPIPPEEPSGITIGWQGNIYDFTTRGFDSDYDKIQFAWDWDGDYSIDEVTGFYDSWESCTLSHIWTMGQIYYMRVMAIDEKGLASDWSNSHKVRINAPNGINGVEVEEWSLGHIYSYYFNHEKTQEIIEMIRNGGNVVVAISALITAIATACGVPVPYAVVISIVTAVIRLGVEILNMMDVGMGVYVRFYVTEYGLTYPCFAYIWSQTAMGGEGDPPLGNGQPMKPDAPYGQKKIKVGRYYSYSAFSIDPDGDDIAYIFDWGDGEYSCSDSQQSGKSYEASHKWTEKGSYQIKVKIVDKWGYESLWSDPLKVSTDRSRSNFNSKILDIFLNFKNLNILQILQNLTD